VSRAYWEGPGTRTKLTDAVPSPEDIARVEEHVNRYHDWPLEAS
jgi:hypothetical protein